MIQIIKIKLLDNLLVGVSFNFTISVPSQLFEIDKSYTFASPVTDPDTQMNVGAGIISTYVTTGIKLDALLDVPYSFITVDGDVDNTTIIITVTGEEVTVGGSSSAANVEVTTEDIPQPGVFIDGVLLSRSPQFVAITPTEPFDAATLGLKLYRGDVLGDVPATVTWPLSKSVVQAGQQKIVFNIQNLVNDLVKQSYSHIVQGAGAFTTSAYESVWVQADIAATYQGEEVGAATRRYLAVDGFGYHTGGPNPQLTQKILSSVERHIFYGDNCPLYFLTKDLTSITVNGQDVPFTFSQAYNNQVVAYVNAAHYATANNVQYAAVFVYGEGEDAVTYTHYFTRLAECRYAVATCYFKNRFGYWQTIPFAKLSKNGLETSSTDYEAIVSDYDTYNLMAHGTREFDVRGVETISVNTDFIPEAYNELFTEMMLSEMVYLHQSGVILPVNKATRNFRKKTRKNDKLIQYSMDFKYSFNVINSVV